MREYLDKQKLLMVLNDKYHDMASMPASYYAGFQYAVKMIERLHVSEEVAPVVHGKWIHLSGCGVCSVCNYKTGKHEVGRNFCPEYGAKLDLEDKE